MSQLDEKWPNDPAPNDPPPWPDIYEFSRRQQAIKTQGYVYLGSSDSPVTTEMLTTGNNLKQSLNLMGVMSETWLAVLLSKLEV